MDNKKTVEILEAIIKEINEKLKLGYDNGTKHGLEMAGKIINKHLKEVTQ